MIVPGTSDFYSRVAALRPGDAPDWLNALLPTADRSIDKFNRFDWKDFHLTLSDDGKVGECEYLCSFPNDVSIEGVRMGMSVEAAREAQPRLRFLGPQPYRSGEYYDLVPGDGDWDLLVEAGEAISSIIALPKGKADERADWAARSLEARARRWREPFERDRWMTIDDPEALLDAWLETEGAAAPWSNYPTNISAAHAAWLKQATPDEWHEAARGHNWSYSPAPLFFISRHPDCDLATALYIFYATWPQDFGRKHFDPARVNDHGTLRLVIGIRDRVLSGSYRRSELAFDPMRSFGPRWQPVDLGPMFPVKLEGREPARLPIQDGYPVAAWNTMGVTFPV